jgi:peptidoglycan/xylan/chitin deacetylase (PgdA/CDA1 family)
MPRIELSGGRRRRRFPVPRLAVAALVVLVAAVVIAAAGGGHGAGARRAVSPAAVTRAAPQVAPAHRIAARHPHPDSSHSVRLAARQVDAVLRRTPFVTAGAGRARLVALTFDDGPSPYTGPIVRTLVRLRVPATFFVVGQQLRYFAAGLHDELQHGFVIGDHTVNHALLPRLGRGAQGAQIALDERMLRAAGAPPVRLFRPPYGAYDAVTLSILRRLHMLMVMWSVDPGDWRRPGARAIVTGVLRSVRPGTIVILHDGGGDRTQTIAALPAIIHGLQRRGYRLVTVPELISRDPPPRHQRLPRTIGA